MTHFDTYDLLTEYMTFLNIFYINVAIAGDDEDVLEFSMVEILEVVVKHIRELDALAFCFNHYVTLLNHLN